MATFKFGKRDSDRKDSGRRDSRSSRPSGGRDSPRSFSRDSARPSGGRDSDRSFSRDRPARDFDRGGGRSSRGSSDHEMHEVICDKCGKKCEVPFKPTSSKPVFCSDCFRKVEKTDKTELKVKAGENLEELKQINFKLDKIMNFLKIK